jgi:hypothetical protein
MPYGAPHLDMIGLVKWRLETIHRNNAKRIKKVRRVDL